MRIPNKPFSNYKWRWAEYTPSEGLNHPVRLIGVLRALYKFQGEPKSTTKILNDLERIERETNQLTGEKVTLSRVGERNLFRNADRYWKGVGLLDSDSRTILLTPFGIKVAEGKITQTEFAISVIKSLTLPNRFIETDYSEWITANIEIKPLELILQIINGLYHSAGENQAYLTPFELQKIIIPFAGDNGTLYEYVQAITEYREGKLDLSLYPNCASRSNDERMVREFLLFLSNYGFCNQHKGKTNSQDRYLLDKNYITEIEAIINIPVQQKIFEQVIDEIRNNQVILNTERQKILTKVFSRPQQVQFRKLVLTKYENQCLLTGERMNIVLEACHIIPVEHKGGDTYINGICFRSDIHILYDSKHIRMRPDGILEYSEALQHSKSYSQLPKKINLPSFISKEALNWRYEYY